MKYLIDMVDKQVGSLARQYKNLNTDDEYLIYAPDYCNIEGKDFYETTDNYFNEDKLFFNNFENDNDSRRMKFTTDFETALNWCDCYVSFFSIPFTLGNWGDIEAAQTVIDNLLKRIEQAKFLNKKIYLGNAFSEEFDSIARNYENSLNSFLTEDDLNNFSEYNEQFQSGYISDVKVTMVVGTNSSCGKFSSALKVKKSFEDKGEKVCLIHTEETYPFLDNQDNTIYGFCRNFSDLTTDQDLEYLQCLVVKIISEQHPDRIIFVTQAGIGINGVLANSPLTKTGKKMKGVWDILIERSFGLDDVVICTNWNTLPILEKLIAYYNIRNTEVDSIYVSPVSFGSSAQTVYEPENQTDTFYKTDTKGNISEVNAALKGLAINHPNIPIYCNYDNITKNIETFKKENSFKEDVINKYKGDIQSYINNLNFVDSTSSEGEIIE